MFYKYAVIILSFVKLHWKLLTTISIIVIALLWLSGRSVIQINSSEPEKESTVKILNQGNGKSINYQGKLSGKKFYIPKGSYEVDVDTDGKSFYSINTTKGFFLNTKVDAQLEEEKGRSFVGNEPGTCLSYFDSILTSYACGAALSKAYTHVPATQTTPTYVLKNNSVSVDGYIEGSASTKEGNLVLMNSYYSVEEEARRGHYIEIMKTNVFKPKEEVLLENLDQNKKYQITKYKDGFLVYSDSIDEVFYYKSLKASPEKISLVETKLKNSIATSLNADNDSFVITYSNNRGDSTDKTSGSVSPKFEVIKYVNNNTTSYSFNGNYFSAKLCPQETICLFDGENLEVYETNHKKPHLKFKVMDVSNVEPVGDAEIIVVRNEGITNININSQTGYKEFSFGESTYNSTHPQENGNYILNLTNNQLKGVAILINRSSVSDSIDKKISDLQRQPEISNVSINGNYIYISPQAGEMIALPDGTFDYDPIKLREVNIKIKDLVNKSQLDSKYKVINTLE